MCLRWERWDEAHLKSADQCIVDFVAVHLGSLVLDTRPSPHVLVVATVPGMLDNDCCDDPKEHADDELEQVSTLISDEEIH